MKKVFHLFVLSLLFTSNFFAQKENAANGISIIEDQKSNVVFDNYGNKYSLSDLKVKNDRDLNSNRTFATCNSGFFRLNFTANSGMDGNTAIEVQRRAVVCQVFSDISNFINTPLHTNGTLVEIWVRDINPLLNPTTANPNPALTSRVLGMASGFYVLPAANTSAHVNGGIADNEIWKTVKSGFDSYINTGSPLISTNDSSGSSSGIYHGMVAINFRNTSVNWNLDLTTNATINEIDLYSVVLHEVIHALGFASLIGDVGQSRFGVGYNYYSRYDTFLRNTANNELINNSSDANACSPIYNNSFVANINDIHPTTSNPCTTDDTNCSTAVRFLGSTTVPVYTPQCYEGGSSLSHFEDECIGAPNGNNFNNYFVMTNANGPGSTKRFMRVEERDALCSIGYDLFNTYGSTATFNGQINFGGAISCGSTIPVGRNDVGYSGIINVDIPVTNILGNDINVTGFECLQDVYYNTATTTINGMQTLALGNGTTVINFRSSQPGWHLLRYVPLNGNQRGNITYVYVFVNSPNNVNNTVWGANPCATPTNCNLVINGDFETFSQLPNNFSQINFACNWMSGQNGSPDYYHVNSTAANFSIPNNNFGNQNVNPASGGSAYVGMYAISDFAPPTIPNYNEPLATRLAAPLLPNTNYQIRFDVSLSSYINNPISFQALLSRQAPVYNPVNYGDIPINLTNNDILVDNEPNISVNTIGWDTIVFNFRTGNVAGQEFLYIGGISDVNYQFPNAQPIPNFYNTASYYYVDNVSLVPIYDGELEFPVPVCVEDTLDNLSDYLLSAPVGGVFTGQGVVQNGTVFSFNASIAGVGQHDITYTFTDGIGCPPVIVTGTIDVVGNGILPVFTQIEPLCSGENTPFFSNVDTNGITGSWSPTFDNTTTTTYTFTPDAGQCAIATTMTVVIMECVCNTIINTWNGSLWSTGSVPTLDENVIIDGNYDTTLNGNINACNLTVIAGRNLIVTSNHFVKIRNNFTVEPSAVFDINDDASLIQLNDTGVNTGNIIYRRSVDMRLLDYVYWSSPINQFNTNNISPLSPTSLIFRWDPTFPNPNLSQGYWLNSANNIMEAGRGYIVRGPNNFNTAPQLFTANFQNFSNINSGRPNNGVITKAISRGSIVPGNIPATPANTTTITEYSDNFNLIGNPYPSALDAELFLSNPLNLNIQGAAYFWTHGINPDSSIINPFYEGFQVNYSPNDYVAYNSVGLQNGPGNFKIAGGQGFFVVMEDGAAVPENGSVVVTFNNSMRYDVNDESISFNNSNFFKVNETVKSSNTIVNEKNRIWLDIVNSSNQSVRTLIGYVSGATMGKDRMYDAMTLPNGNLSLYTHIGSDILAIQGRSLPFDINDNVDLGLNMATNGEYKIALHAIDGIFEGNQNIYLKDNLLNLYHNLKVSPYVFTAISGRYDDRFKLVYIAPNTTQLISSQCNTTLPALNTIIYANLVPNAQNYNWIVKNNVTNITHSFSTTGRSFQLTNTSLGFPTNFVKFGSTYTISVRVKINNVYQAFGNECVVTTPNIPITQIQCPSGPLTNIDSYINANINNYATAYRFEVKNLTTNQVGHIDRSLRNFMLTSITNVVPSLLTPFAMYNTQYSVKVALLVNGDQGDYSQECIITTPNIPITQIQCPSGPLPTINSYINANINNYATAYRFEVKNLTTNQVGHIDRSLRNFMLTSITDVAPSSSNAFATFNTQYSVKVALLVNGNQGEYSQECIITTPNIPITQIQCSPSPLPTINSYINANINNYATTYRFEVKNLTTNQVGHIDRSLRNFMLTSITDVTPSSSNAFATYNTQYSVKVALLVSGIQGDYSEECIVATPSTYSKTNNYVSSDFKAVPIPNPFSNEFSIQIKSKSDELITIKVYDMIGKLLDNYVAKTENIGELYFGRNYPSGFYNIIITQGNNVEKLKIIKK